jgi:hypothetical protein
MHGASPRVSKFTLPNLANGPFQQVTMLFSLDAIRHVVRFIYERPSVITWNHGRVLYNSGDLSSAVDLRDEDRVGGVRGCQIGDIIARPRVRPPEEALEHPTPRRTRFGVRIAHPSWTSSTRAAWGPTCLQDPQTSATAVLSASGSRTAAVGHQTVRPHCVLEPFLRATRSPHLPKHG